ncbi:uncharacterized protein LOC125670121 [Ostrea edulis]|uniref:uncharacterized protein LOC125670121 n=1 Tax=Ostrea edulis TaxID=37623 RepID=UPI0020941E70|nr:uncharacterized protein LOC125670121 [Ostrea edulis]
MKVLLYTILFAIVLVFVQATHEEGCPSKQKLESMDQISLNNAAPCKKDRHCQTDERCCRTSYGRKCLDTDDTDSENKDEDDDCKDEGDKKHGDHDHDRHSKCHRHFSRPMILSASVLGVMLLLVVTLTLVRKFCVRRKIGNSQINIGTKYPNGRSTDYALRPKTSDVEKSTKVNVQEQNWLNDTPPPPYFIPSAPPAYSVDPPPSYSQAKICEKVDKY